mgnify:CR=1 FL=1
MKPKRRLARPNAFEKVRRKLEEARFASSYSEITMIPQSTVKLGGKEAQQMLRLMESLEDSDDVQHVYANFDIPDAEMEQLSA